MARYTTTVDSPRPAEDVFAYLARFSNAAEWDPGVAEAEDRSGGTLGEGSTFRLVVTFLGRRLPLEYRIVSFDPPSRVVLNAENRSVRSTDEIRVSARNGGSRVVYDAELVPTGAAAVVGPLLGFLFRRIGDRAAAGLAATLGGSVAGST